MNRIIIEFEAKIETEPDNSFRVVEYNGFRHYTINLAAGAEIVERRLIRADTPIETISKMMQEMVDEAFAITKDANDQLFIAQSPNYFSGVL